MEIFPGVTEEELKVAEILLGLSQKILFPIIDVDWSRKRKRSSFSCKRVLSTTIEFTPSATTPSSSTSSAVILSPEPLTVVMPPPPPPLPVHVENHELLTTSLKKASRKKRHISVPVVAAKPSDEVLNPSEPEQNPAKKMRREDVSQELSMASKQKEALVNGMEAAMKIYVQLKEYQLKLEEKELFMCINERVKAVMRFYEQIKENKVQLEEKERKMNQCLEQEEQILKQQREQEERILKQQREQEEQNLKQRLEEEERHSQQNHTSITKDNRQARPMFDLNLPPLED